MNIILRAMYAWGIIIAITSLIDKRCPTWVTGLGGVLIGIGSNGWANQ